jgi:hypothetical protein
MATSNQTTTSNTPAAKTTGNSGTTTAKKPRRVAAGKAIRIDTDVLGKLDERSQRMISTFGFKPTPSQVIGYLLRTQQAIDDAKAAGAAASIAAATPAAGATTAQRVGA